MIAASTLPTFYQKAEIIAALNLELITFIKEKLFNMLK